MKRIALVVCSVGCVSSYQSARVLPTGKTQVTVAVSRVQALEDGDEDESVWVGDLQVRHGFAAQFDGGIRLSRTPGGLNSLSMLTIDPKYQITSPSSSTAVSIGVPFGVAWEEQGSDFEDGIGVIAPTLLIGTPLAASTELVFAPKVVVFLPDGDTEESEIEFGASIGLRFTNSARTWAIHPELSLLLFDPSNGSEGGETAKILSFGVAVSAGN
ncbi:MAG: hypothetical protein H0T42_13365 [Deltaproteobacteria bacterium]|nr:hypothetical protein [Deltaproteobacteria bacterium]